MKYLRVASILFLVFLLSACEKTIETPIESEPTIEPVAIQSIHFEQEEVYYISDFDLKTLSFEIHYEDDSQLDMFMDWAMFSTQDQTKLRSKGLHQVMLDYNGYQKDIMIYIVDFDKSVELLTIYFEKPLEKIPSNEFDFSMLKICFEFSNGTAEKYQLLESMVTVSDIKDSYPIGYNQFSAPMLGQAGFFSVEITHPNITYVDERELYTGDIGDDVIIKLEELLYSYTNPKQAVGRIILTTDIGFILYDGETHIFMRYDQANNFKINDEVLVDVEAVYLYGSFNYVVNDILLVQRYMPYEVEAPFFEIKDYIQTYKLKDDDLKYRFRGIFTIIDDRLVFTDGDIEFREIIYDDETYLVILEHLHQVVDVNFYFVQRSYSRVFMLDLYDLGITVLDEDYQEHYSDYFLNIEINHIINDFPTVITKTDSLNLVGEGIFGSTVTWMTYAPNIISEEGIVQSGVNKYTCAPLRFTIDNGDKHIGIAIDICITAGEPMTLKQADIISFNTDHEVIVQGLILNSIFGVSLIYDGTSYAFVNYVGNPGDMIEVHGFYEKYEGYLGGLSYPYIVKPSTQTFLKPDAIDDFDFENDLLDETMFGKSYVVDMSLISIETYSGWDAFNPMGGIPHLMYASTFKIEGTDILVHLIDHQHIDLESVHSSKKVEFIFLGLNDSNALEGILVSITD